ncbi:axin-1-like isoform X1 [Haliotis cracherodii]|uniref:axin-1-like isoform X1 n=1 Tax=Haliotis cracherodii TaxID=6455 RepID=UPI0039E81944
MTSKVYEFLNDSGGNNFTESAPRPPVPGEENELQSNGGMSTQSSGSHKSHLSNKSNRSQSSTKSTKSAASNKGEVSHSPAATPRKSNLEKSSCTSSQKLDHEEMEAPNGYEPEGSAANSPPFTENSTPPHLKWAENLNHLLSDSDGVQLFKEYLDKEGGGALEVDFWFACQGLKRKSAQSTNIPSLVKAIYKHFVRNDGVRCLLKETKQEISDKINKKMAVDQYIYDTAATEVELYMRNVTYPAFLNSDFYVQYVQSYGDSPKSSHSSGSNSARPMSQPGPLPSLPEDKELDTESSKFTTMGPPLFHKVLSHKSYRSDSSGAKRTETISGPSSKQQYPLYCNSRHSSYPNHVSYAPASAQDSELQSLSSDALTDDTMSVTDSSIDASHYNLKRQRKAMKTMAQQNREPNLMLHSQFIPRTERAPKDRNIAETDPQQFAQMLIERMQCVLEEREAGAKVDEKLRCLSEADETAGTSMMKNTTATSIIPMMSTSAVEEETAESILDQHCSRIWANSNHHTPSRSPGRHSPRNKSPDRLRLNKTLPAGGVSGHRSRKRENRDFVASCDSGVGDESCNKETHRHIHHHHHHHHRELRTSKQQMEYEAQKYSMACIGSDLLNNGSRSFSEFHHREIETRGRSSKKSCATRKGSDASSHIDSGISMVFDKDSLLRMPIVTGPNAEKVMQWMMDSERQQEPGSGHQEADKGSSHKNARHRLNQSAGASLQTHKQSSKKVGHGTSRSASVERSSLLSWTPIGQSAQILPNQPFAQDSSMPLPPPPNPTTQLEEARRRLEDQSRTSAMAGSGKRAEGTVRSSSAGPVKSKSFAGVTSRDKSKVVVSQSASQMRTMPSAKTVPSDLDISGGSQTFERPKTYRKPPPAPNTSMNTSTSAASSSETIVGIYFGQEPIPYRHVFPGRCITLAQFKTLITKKGNFKYYFKRDSDEFGEGAVFEEVGDDNAVLPMWMDKIVAKVEKID